MRRMRILFFTVTAVIMFWGTAAAGLHAVNHSDPSANAVQLRQYDATGQAEINDDLQTSVVGKSDINKDDPIPAIPEPASLLLVGIGVIGTGVMRKLISK